MASAEAERALAELFRAKNDPRPSVIEARKQRAERAESDGIPAGTKTSSVQAGGVLAEWVEHPDCDGEGVFLLMHGGGFSVGGPITHRKFASYLSQATNMRVLVPDYRLAPEHPFPAAVHDCLAVYGALLSDGIPAENIAVGGDSAGAGLAASMLIALKVADGPMPSSLTLISGWLDLTNSGDTYQSNADDDPTTSKKQHDSDGAAYFDQADPKNPIISPLFANLKGMPPTLLQVGDIEVMLDDSREFADRAKAAGVEVELEVWPRMWHAWHHWAPEVPESLEGFSKIGTFVKLHAKS